MGMSPVMSGFASNDLQSKSTPERVAAAAKEFEAVLIEQMLKEARTSSGLSEEQDQASATLREIADQQFARLIASQGGLGVTRCYWKASKRTPPRVPSQQARPQPRPRRRLPCWTRPARPRRIVPHPPTAPTGPRERAVPPPASRRAPWPERCRRAPRLQYLPLTLP